MAVLKEFNIKQHYEEHSEKYDKHIGQLRMGKVNEL